ncbi:MAG: hypothetical protein AAFX05_04675 [Planctomycetota bacterium]
MPRPRLWSALCACSIVSAVSTNAFGATTSSTRSIVPDRPTAGDESLFGITLTRTDTGESVTQIRTMRPTAHGWSTDLDDPHVQGGARINEGRRLEGNRKIVDLWFELQAFPVETIVSAFVYEARFPIYHDASASLEASIDVTDMDGDGAAIMPERSQAYVAHYNEFAGPAFGGLFPHGVLASARSGSRMAEAYPAPGEFAPFPEDVVVTGASATIVFRLSANDHVHFRSTYTVVPAPASVMLMLAGTASLMPRRRR